MPDANDIAACTSKPIFTFSDCNSEACDDGSDNEIHGSNSLGYGDSSEDSSEGEAKFLDEMTIFQLRTRARRRPLIND